MKQESRPDPDAVIRAAVTLLGLKAPPQPQRLRRRVDPRALTKRDLAPRPSPRLLRFETTHRCPKCGIRHAGYVLIPGSVSRTEVQVGQDRSRLRQHNRDDPLPAIMPDHFTLKVLEVSQETLTSGRYRKSRQDTGLLARVLGLPDPDHPLIDRVGLSQEFPETALALTIVGFFTLLFGAIALVCWLGT